MYALSAPALLMFYAAFKLSEGQDIIAAAWMEERVAFSLEWLFHFSHSNRLLKLFIHSERAAAIKM